MSNPLFRAKPISGGKLVQGQIHTYGNSVYITQTQLMNNNGYDWRVPAIEIDPETISQFTGYFDKYQISIFEGDILNYYDHNADMRMEYPVKKLKDGSFKVDSIAVCEICSTSRIVGNIYESHT